LKSAKEIWDVIKTTHEGDKVTKKTKREMIEGELRQFTLNKGEEPQAMYNRIKTLGRNVTPTRAPPTRTRPTSPSTRVFSSPTATTSASWLRREKRTYTLETPLSILLSIMRVIPVTMKKIYPCFN
jgi:hypothetical protein